MFKSANIIMSYSSKAITDQQSSRAHDHCQAPVVGVVDGDEDEVLAEDVHVLGPAGHQRVPGLVRPLGGQARVEHAVEAVDARALLLGHVAEQVLDLQVDEVVVQVLARLQALQVASEDRDGVLLESSEAGDAHVA